MIDNNFSGSGGGGGAKSATHTRDNLISQDYVEIILGVGKGPIKGLVTPESNSVKKGPLQSLYLGDTSVQSLSDGSPNFADFKITQFVGEHDDSPIERVLGGDASNQTINTTLAQSVPVVRTTPSSLRKTDTFKGISRIEVRILFNQLVKQNDEGDFNHTALFKIEYRATNSPTWLNYNGEAQISITGKTTGGYVKDFAITVEPLVGYDYEVRVTKVSPDNNLQEVVVMTWESMQCVTLHKPEYPGLAKLHIYGRISQQFSSMPDISGIYEGRLIWVPSNYNPVTRTYDESVPWNGTLVKAYSNNNAWALYFLLMDTDDGLAHYYKDVIVNLQEFYKAGKWCDEQVPTMVNGVTQPRFTFNENLDTQRLGLELLQYVAGSFNSTIYDENNGVIRLKTDAPSVSKQLFTPENVTVEGFGYSFTDITTRYNDVKVQFVNPDMNWEIDERSASIDCSDWQEQNGIIPFSFQAVGCTNLHEAIRRANDRVLTSNTEVTTVQFETTRFGFLAEIYDTITIADPISGWSTGGRIKSYAGGVIQLRDPIFTVAPNAPCNIKIQTYSGIVEVTVQPPVVGLNYTLTVVAGTYPTNVPDRTVFTLENTTNIGLTKPFRVIGITEIDGDPNRWGISAIEINPSKYADSANGTVSVPTVYDYETPGEPVLPSALTLKNIAPILSSDGSLTYRIAASWVRPSNAYTDRYELDYTELNSGTWNTVTVYGESTEFGPVKDGRSYSVELFAITPTGNRSRKSVLVTGFVVTKKSATLENVTGFDVVETATGWLAQFNLPTNIKDLSGTRVKFGGVNDSWGSLPAIYLSVDKTQALPWFVAGDVKVQARYVNTSGNESVTSAVKTLTILPPLLPTVTVSTSMGPSQLTFDDCTTSQPLAKILVRKGSNTSTWNTATLESFTLGAEQRSFTINPSATEDQRVFLRAMDVAGNLGAIALIPLPKGTGDISALLDQIKGDIDETWITPELLNHIDFGDISVTGSLPNQLNTVKSLVYMGSLTNSDFTVGKENWQNIGATFTVESNSEASGGKVGKLTGVSGQIHLVHTKPIPVDTSHTYKTRIRIRRLNGSGGAFYVGMEGRNSGGASISNPGFASYPYFVAGGVLLPADSVWRTFEGTISGVTQVGTSGPKNQFLSGTVLGAPIFFTHGAWTGDVEIDYLTFEDITDVKLLQAIVETEASTRAEETGHLGAQWTTKVAFDVDGETPIIGGIALAGVSDGTAGGTTFDFAIRANKIAFLPPAGSGNVNYKPFVYYTTQTTLSSGIIVEPGLYLESAFIKEIKADRIDTRGMIIKALDGTPSMVMGETLALSTLNLPPNINNTPGGWLNSQQQWNEVGGLGRPTQGANIILNGSFEGGTQDWSAEAVVHGGNLAGAAINAQTIGDPIAGSKVLEISGPQTVAVSRAVPVIPGKRYRVRFRFRARAARVTGYWYYGAASSRPATGFCGGDAETWVPLPAPSSELSIPVSSTWGSYDSLVDIPANRYWFSLGLHRWGQSDSGAVLQIDDVEVTPYTVSEKDQFYGDSEVTVIGNTFTKTAGVENTWGGQARSKVGFTQGAQFSFVANSLIDGYMVGFNVSAGDGNTYSTLDRAIYIEAGKCYLWRGADQAVSNYISVTVGDVFAGTWDGVTCRMYRNGTEIISSRSDFAPYTPGAPVFLDTSFVNIGSKVEGVTWGPMSSNQWGAIGSRPSDSELLNSNQTWAQVVNRPSAAGSSLMINYGTDLAYVNASDPATCSIVSDTSASDGFAMRCVGGWAGTTVLSGTTATAARGLVQGKKYRVFLRGRKVGTPAGGGMGIYSDQTGGVMGFGDMAGHFTTPSWKVAYLGVFEPNWASTHNVYIYFGSGNGWGQVSEANAPSNHFLFDWLYFQPVNAEEDATKGATWGSNVSGQPSDSALMNSYVAMGANMIPNSSCTITSCWFTSPAYHETVLPALYANKLASTIWADTYVLKGVVNNVTWNQEGTLSGGEDRAAVDVYPLGGPWETRYSLPATAGKYYMWSVYAHMHRCGVGVGIYFYNNLNQETGRVDPPPRQNIGAGRCEYLSEYIRPFVKMQAPPGTAYMRVFVRKFNTNAATDSWLWLAAPQLEVVGADATGPSEYTPGPATSIGQLGYTGSMNATTNRSDADTNTVISSAQTAAVEAAATAASNTYLQKSGGVIAGRITSTVADGIFAGTDTNNGVYFGKNGLVGVQGGSVKLAINSNGSAAFAGDLDILGTSGGGSTKITNNKIEVRDSINTLRVKIGYLL